MSCFCTADHHSVMRLSSADRHNVMLFRIHRFLMNFCPVRHLRNIRDHNHPPALHMNLCGYCFSAAENLLMFFCPEISDRFLIRTDGSHSRLLRSYSADNGNYLHDNLCHHTPAALCFSYPGYHMTGYVNDYLLHRNHDHPYHSSQAHYMKEYHIPHVLRFLLA